MQQAMTVKTCTNFKVEFSNVARLPGTNFDNRVPFLVGVFASILDTKKTNIATRVVFVVFP